MTPPCLQGALSGGETRHVQRACDSVDGKGRCAGQGVGSLVKVVFHPGLKGRIAVPQGGTVERPRC